MKEQRRFKRIPMDGPVVLSCADAQWNSALLDISLKGALITIPTGWTGQPGEQCKLSITLDNGVMIELDGSVAHAGEQQLGIRCENMSLDSASHLRRMVELNLGDPELLERELGELIRSK